ncbi:MAG: hypothetical protein Q4G48_04410 [Bacteroidia bacterium]|nr:hypothetical protein [Bacteroidia bacterium]
MKRFTVIVPQSVLYQIDEYINFISQKYKAPLTAYRHYDALMQVIRNLETTAHLNPIRYTESLQRNYGAFVRRVNFINMTFVYCIYANDEVYIHEFIAQKMIKDK